MTVLYMHRLLMAPATEGTDLAGDDRGDKFEATDDHTEVVEREPAKGKPKAGIDKPKDAKPKEDKPKEDEGEDEDDEVEETEEEKTGREAEEAKATKDAKKDSRIPLSRHKEILDKERATRADLERQVEAFKKGNQVAATNEDITKLEDAIVKMEREYNGLLADGELDKASALMARIRGAERSIGDQRSEMRSQVAEARAYERVRYDNIVERLEAAYPVLNTDHADFDAAQVGEVLELKEAYQMKGYAPADALQKAAKVLLGAASAREKRAVDTDVRVDKEDLSKATAEERRKTAVERNLKVAGKQPADMSRVGLDSDKAGGSLTARDAVKLSHEEFGKLDETTLARMRGDVIA